MESKQQARSICSPQFEFINILAGSIHTVKENSEALIVVSKETGLEVNADKSKYKVMS